MPGMMDTILNLGLNEQVVDVIAAKSGNPRWAWAAVATVVSSLRKSWYKEYMSVLEVLSQCILDRAKEAHE